MSALVSLTWAGVAVSLHWNRDVAALGLECWWRTPRLIAHLGPASLSCGRVRA
jgi:hypothetical protein